MQQSLEILRTLNNAYEAARTTLQIAIVKEETKQAEDALTLCIDAKQVFERLEAAADLRKAQDLYLYFLVKEKR
ncbi:hypothetical protein KFU94_42695 [Chloroflexi bacterium TSY]|nr:hypothetical protein [Chloroflexi bacterium TSY]